MQQFIFTVYDEKAQAYLNPFFMAQDGMAIRAITDALGDPEHQFSKHPADFTLYRIGIFDDSDGTIQEKKQLLTTILELKATTSNIININQQEMFEENK